MKALTEDRWQEIREIANAEYLNSQPPSIKALNELLQQHDHLAAQIKLLADYIMSKRPDDPAWALGGGACAIAAEIIRRQSNEISDLNGYCDLVDRAKNEIFKIVNKL